MGHLLGRVLEFEALESRKGAKREGFFALVGCIELAVATLVLFAGAGGPEHPDVAITVHNLAALLKATGNLAEAQSLYERAWGRRSSQNWAPRSVSRT